MRCPLVRRPFPAPRTGRVHETTALSLPKCAPNEHLEPRPSLRNPATLAGRQAGVETSATACLKENAPLAAGRL